MKALLVAGAALAIAAQASTAAAQTPSPNPVVVVSLNMCAFDRLDSLAAVFRSRSQPLWSEQVTAGKIINFGVLRHAWGDEWNWVTYFTAPDLQTFLTARDEVLRKARERFGTTPVTQGFCTAHKDNIYNVVVGEPAPPPRRP